MQCVPLASDTSLWFGSEIQISQGEKGGSEEKPLRVCSAGSRDAEVYYLVLGLTNFQEHSYCSLHREDTLNRFSTLGKLVEGTDTLPSGKLNKLNNRQCSKEDLSP